MIGNFHEFFFKNSINLPLDSQKISKTRRRLGNVQIFSDYYDKKIANHSRIYLVFPKIVMI